MRWISWLGFLSSLACSLILSLLIMVSTSKSLVSICSTSMGVDGGTTHILFSIPSSILLISLVFVLFRYGAALLYIITGMTQVDSNCQKASISIIFCVIWKTASLFPFIYLMWSSAFLLFSLNTCICRCTQRSSLSLNATFLPIFITLVFTSPYCVISVRCVQHLLHFYWVWCDQEDIIHP